jgi:CRP-like cAMP-binding protein
MKPVPQPDANESTSRPGPEGAQFNTRIPIICSSPGPGQTSLSRAGKAPDSMNSSEGLLMTIGALAPNNNRLLASLPAEEYRRLLPDLQPIELEVGDILQKPGQNQACAIFPCAGSVAMNYQMEDGASVAIAVVGREGLVGLSMFLDGAPASSYAVVQTAGHAFRLGAGPVLRELRSPGRLQLLAFRYVQALMTQTAQTAVCNRHHNLDQQICRWLLLSLDRHPGNELNMTQESIAQMLGVRREGITAAAGKLQDAGVINYSRGRIVILDRPALEALACECYSVVRDEYERLLPVAMGQRRHLQAVHQ